MSPLFFGEFGHRSPSPKRNFTVMHESWCRPSHTSEYEESFGGRSGIFANGKGLVAVATHRAVAAGAYLDLDIRYFTGGAGGASFLDHRDAGWAFGKLASADY